MVPRLLLSTGHQASSPLAYSPPLAATFAPHHRLL